MRRHLSFYMLLAASLGALVAFFALEGPRVTKGFAATLSYMEGEQILADPSLMPQTRRFLASLRFDRALRSAPDTMNMGAQVIQAYETAGVFDEALGLYEQVLTESSPLPLLMSAAACAYQLGDLSRAEPIYNMAMQGYPDDPTAYNGLGYMMAEEGVRLDEAEALLLKALELSANHKATGLLHLLNPASNQFAQLEEATYRDSLGWVYYKQGRFAEAVKELEFANSVLPGHAEVQTHLSLAHAMLENERSGGPAEQRDA